MEDDKNKKVTRLNSIRGTQRFTKPSQTNDIANVQINTEIAIPKALVQSFKNSLPVVISPSPICAVYPVGIFLSNVVQQIPQNKVYRLLLSQKLVPQQIHHRHPNTYTSV